MVKKGRDSPYPPGAYSPSVERRKSKKQHKSIWSIKLAVKDKYRQMQNINVLDPIYNANHKVHRKWHFQTPGIQHLEMQKI